MFGEREEDDGYERVVEEGTDVRACVLAREKRCVVSW